MGDIAFALDGEDVAGVEYEKKVFDVLFGDLWGVVAVAESVGVISDILKDGKLRGERGIEFHDDTKLDGGRFLRQLGICVNTCCECAIN